MFREEIKIPKDRVAVLIGKKGLEKRKLERKAKAKIKVSREGDVIIEGKDSLLLFDLKLVIKAIGRGFNPEIAENLFREDYALEIVEIKEFSGKSKKKLIRLRGRMIGKKGKARQTIEKLTNTSIVIYGKTVSIIGKIEDVMKAKEAVEYLLSGAPHGHVYGWIERKKRKEKMEKYREEFY